MSLIHSPFPPDPVLYPHPQLPLATNDSNQISGLLMSRIAGSINAASHFFLLWIIESLFARLSAAGGPDAS